MFNFFEKIKKKSLKERFLLVFGILIFLSYFVLGLMIMFWESLPFVMTKSYKIALGLTMIIYSFIRFFRLFKLEEENDEIEK